MEVPEWAQLRKDFNPDRISTKVREKPELMESLRKVCAKQHMYVYAPPGYGKTASVLGWLKETHSSCAWIKIDESLNNPDAFFTLFVRAILSFQPENKAFIEKLRDSNASAFTLAEETVNCLADRVGKSTIILDCFWRITDEALIRNLVNLIKSLPESITMIIISRQEPHVLFSDLILRNLMHVMKKDQSLF